MNLTFQQEHKSIKRLPIAELPDFTVITGANGAGKTHFLQAIVSGAIQIVDVPVKKIKYYTWSDMVSPDEAPNNPIQWQQNRDQYCASFSEFIKQFSNQVSESITPYLSEITHAFSSDSLPGMEELNNLLPPHHCEVVAANIAQIEHSLIAHLKHICLHGVSGYPANQMDPNNSLVLLKVIDLCEKPFYQLTLSDFYEYYPVFNRELDPFKGGLTDLFAGYVRKREQNDLARVRADRGLITLHLTDNEFTESHGSPPWDVMNRVLMEAHLSFRFAEPSPDASRPVGVNLIHVQSGNTIPFAGLSSGERVLISLAHFLFFSRDPRQPTAMPEVILLDEVDAPLHPSMTVDLLRTITKVMVEEYGRKVILATHSPSTVALAPEESIHVMDVETKTLRKATRDEGVRALTVGVPILSINLANRRQVFVESRHDEEFYGRIAALAQTQLRPDISLTFIASGHEENGGCDRVKKLVSQLTGAGNTAVYGIIDWDNKNHSTASLRVLGEGVRHSIENYLLDPVLLGALLLREKLVSREKLGLLDGETYVDLRDFDNFRLQKLTDGVLAELGFAPVQEGQLTTIHYFNGRSVQAPVAYLTERGHTLEEEHIKKRFPQLLQLGKRATDLKSTMLEKVLDDVPGLLPADFVSLLLSIQNNH